MFGPLRSRRQGRGLAAAWIAVLTVIAALLCMATPAAAATVNLPSGEVNVPYIVALAGDTGTVTAVAVITAGTLPPGLSLDPTLGIVTGTPTTPGVSTFTASVTDVDGHVSVITFTLSIAPTPVVNDPTLPAAEVGVPFSGILAVSGGLPPYTWTVRSGSLPSGLTLSPSTGTISGTPTTAGSSTFAVTVTDVNSFGSSKTVTMTVATQPAVSTVAVPTGEATTFYITTLAASAGVAPFSWSITDGTLPRGLTLNAGTGTISGTPAVVGINNFTIRVTDANRQAATRSFSLTVVAPPTSPLPDAEVGTFYRVVLASTGGRGPVIWSIVSGSLPAGFVLDSISGTISGTPVAPSMSKLTVMATDVNGQTAQTGLSLTVRPNARTYWLVASDGGIFAYGRAPFLGSTGSITLNRPIVGMAATPNGNGYWLVGSDGGVFAFGSAGYFGSTAALPLQHPIVGIVATPDGNGYWLVAGDGGVFPFGTAPYLGSTDSLRLTSPIVAMTATADGRGYWLVASDGGIFAFGNAMFYGSTHGARLNRPIVSMAPTPDGGGYWLVASDGGVFAYGNAAWFGSAGATPLNRPIVTIVATPNGKGYWLAAADGGVFAYGNAAYLGSSGGTRLNRPMIAMVGLH